MKKLPFLLSMVFVAALAPAILAQVEADSFSIKNVYIVLDADTRYVRKLADKTISSDKPSNNDEIGCFKNELIETGLFEIIETELVKAGEQDSYDLNVSLKFRSTDPVYEIGQIEVIEYLQIDRDRFGSLLAENLGKEIRLSLKTGFPLFEKEIERAVRDSFRGDATERGSLAPWIELNLNSAGRLDVKVAPQFTGCGSM